jgi:hypothetical protein
MAEEDISLRFECPTCAAGPKEKCLAHNGAARCESHAERMEIAMEYFCPRQENEDEFSASVEISQKKERTARTSRKPAIKA